MQSHPPEADHRVLPPNLVILGGTVGAEPEARQGPAGETVLRLRLEHPIPGGGGGIGGGSVGDTSVLVLQRVADTFPSPLRVGAAVLIVGHALGGGDVFADALIPTAL